MGLKNQSNQYKLEYEIASHVCLFFSINVHQLHYKTWLKHSIWDQYTIYLLI
jgi:hypothetical protein